MSSKDFLSLIDSENVISGNFNLVKTEDLMMDRNFSDKQFLQCRIEGGDFASSSFINCTFDKVVFKNLSMVAVSFENCNFVDCEFQNVELDAGMRNCQIGRLIIIKKNL